MWWFLGGLWLGLIIGLILAGTLAAAKDYDDNISPDNLTLIPKDGPPTPPWS